MRLVGERERVKLPRKDKSCISRALFVTLGLCPATCCSSILKREKMGDFQTGGEPFPKVPHHPVHFIMVAFEII